MSRDAASRAVRHLLSPNMVLRVAGGDAEEGEALVRVLWLPPGMELVVVATVSDPRCLPVWLGLGKFLDGIETGEYAPCGGDDPVRATIRLDSALSEAEKLERKWRWHVISSLVENPRRPDLRDGERQRRVQERLLDLKDELGRREELDDALKALLEGRKLPRSDRVLGWLRLYWSKGQVQNALVPEFTERGGPGKDRIAPPGAPKRGRLPDNLAEHGQLGVNVTQDALEKLQAGAMFRKIGELTLKASHRRTVLLGYGQRALVDGVPGLLTPPEGTVFSAWQYRYHTNKILAAPALLKARLGDAKFARRHRPRLGCDDPTKQFGPGSEFQIDATVADIYLRSRHDRRRLIGRPVLYLVVDRWSRMIVGFHVALRGPSWEMAARALEVSFSDKVAFCASLGMRPIERSQWPSRHVCEVLTGDRGWDVLRDAAAAAGFALGYRVANLPPYRPDLKGLVEGMFLFINTYDVWTPGAWRARERGDLPQPLDGAFTIDEFYQYMAIRIMAHNATHVVRDPPPGWDYGLGFAPTPLLLWTYGCEVLSIPRREDPLRIRAALLQPGTAKETDAGLLFRQLHYVPADADRARFERWFTRSPRRTWNDREIRWSPSSVDRVYAVLGGGEEFVEFGLHGKYHDYAGCSFEEAEEFRACKKIDVRLTADARNAAADKYRALEGEVIGNAWRNGASEVPRTKRPRTDPLARKLEAREMDERLAHGCVRAPLLLPAPPPPSADAAEPAAAAALPPPQAAQPAAAAPSLLPDRSSLLRALRDAALGAKGGASDG